MFTIRNMLSARTSWMAIMLVTAAIASAILGCHSQTEDLGERAGFAVRDTSDCLPDVTLLDDRGQKVSLTSLRGKPVLFDFIYTSCPGECLLLTQRMKRIAALLGPALGTKMYLVSLTVDPEHDQPQQLLAYAHNQGAEMSGWLFLTGTPAQIETVMAGFNLIRQREADGTVDHVPVFFLVNGSGRALLQYVGEKADPELVVRDIRRAADGKAVTTSDGEKVAASF